MHRLEGVIKIFCITVHIYIHTYIHTYIHVPIIYYWMIFPSCSITTYNVYTATDCEIY